MEIRLAEDRDVPEIMAVMREAHEAMADPTAYLTDPEDYVRDHVSRRGFILLGEQDGKLAGFFMVSLPGLGAGNLGYYLDFPKKMLLQTAIMDSVAVRPCFQGQGIMVRLLTAAAQRAEGTHPILLGTVAPENQPSRKSFLSCGFTCLLEIEKPGGLRRLLMGRGLPEEMAHTGRCSL